MLGCIKEFYAQPVKLLCCVWGWLLDLWLIIKPCRFSVFSLIVGFVFFGLAPQGIDILRSMTETGEGQLLSYAAFYACIWLWALSIWYWARHMLRFREVYERATATDNKARAQRLVEEVPRILGGLAFWILWIALLKTGRIYPENIEDNLAIDPDLFAYIYFFSGILFYIFAKSRRWLLGRMLALPDKRLLHQDFITSFMQMPKAARMFALLLTAISLLAFIWTTLDPVGAAAIGTPNLLLIAAANWVFIGSILVFYGERFRFPVFLALLLLALIFSTWNDNHAMRTTGEMKQDTRVAIDQHFNNWLTPRLVKWRSDPTTAGKPYPLFLVAAEGGGIRAAYWTANVLGALQDANPEFADHVYAMSGVSGGSLGIATFTAMLKAKQQNASFADECNKTGQFSYQACARTFLQNDFLAPPAGRMLYGDLIQRFWPVPVKDFDRATAIEKGWEEAWQEMTGTDYFNENFLKLYDGVDDLPALFLNSTWVEKGFRTATSNLQLDDKIFLHVKDLHSITEKHLRLSTAVHNSARFTYVSPAGTVNDINNQAWGHVVDGGYFENSGTTTLAEAYLRIMWQAGEDWQAIRPVVLMITNEPTQDDTADADASPIANEALSPLRAMLNTRGGRGSLARANMQQLVELQGIFKEFGLQNVDGPVPLGWMLSRAAMLTMDKRLDCYINELPQRDPLNIETGQECNEEKQLPSVKSTTL
ncbi:MAG: hypothetical protein PVG66_15330 [Chromatiales bacterium]|jgi:hypothetical protein